MNPCTTRRTFKVLALASLALALFVPVVRLHGAHDSTSLRGIALAAMGFLGPLWGNPAWFAWVPLLLANRARRAGKTGDVAENLVLFAGISLFVFAVPWTVNRPVWGSTVYSTLGHGIARHTRGFFDIRDSELTFGASLVALAVCMAIAHIVVNERIALSRERRGILRGVVKYAALMAATVLLRAAVLSECAFYPRAASVPGSVFLLSGFLGPFVGHLGWLANLACAAAWWGVLAEHPSLVRRAMWATLAAWASCLSLFVLPLPGDEGLSHEHPSLRVGFVYWTLFLTVPYVARALLEAVTPRQTSR